MNAKSDDLNPDMAAEVPQHPTAHALGDGPTAENVTEALRSLGNSKAVGPDELQVELLNLELHHDPTILREFRQIIIRVWREGKYPKGGVTRSLRSYTKRRTGQSVGTTVASLVAYGGQVILKIVAKRLGD